MAAQKFILRALLVTVAAVLFGLSARADNIVHIWLQMQADRRDRDLANTHRPPTPMPATVLPSWEKQKTIYYETHVQEERPFEERLQSMRSQTDLLRQRYENLEQEHKRQAFEARLQNDPIYALADSQVAINSGKYDEALDLLFGLAQMDNGVAAQAAQYILGRAYAYGKLGQASLKIELRTAVELFRKAAMAGNNSAQAELAKAYLNGDGIEQDFGEALKWFRLAAGQDPNKTNMWLIRAAIRDRSPEAGFTQYKLLGALNHTELAAAFALFGKSYEDVAFLAFGKSDEDGEVRASTNNDERLQRAYEWYALAAQFAGGAQWEAARDAAAAHLDKSQLQAAKNRLARAGETGVFRVNEKYGASSGIYIGGNRDSLIDRLRWAANRGDSKACIGLGRLYQQGLEVPRDSAQANRWLVHAVFLGAKDLPQRAEQELIGKLNHTELAAAFALLGATYENGEEGIRRDEKLAYEWLALAAQLDANPQYDAACDGVGKKLNTVELADAQFTLGNSYDQQVFSGIYIGKNQDLAVKWLRSAARLGNKAAQNRLGSFCRDGSAGVPKDLLAAYAWYSISAYQADAKPTVIVTADKELSGSFEPNRPGMPPDSAAKACFQISPALTKKQLAQAQFLVGRFFGSELSAPDPRAAIKWFRVAAKNDYANADAEYCLGEAYEKGLGVRGDHKKAAEWYKASASNGSLQGRLAWGTIAAAEVGLFSALGDLRLVADHDNAVAQFRLGEAYEKHGPTPSDLINAYRWYALAASHDDAPAEAAERGIAIGNQLTPAQRAEAFCQIGQMRFEDGDNREAKLWLMESVKEGSVKALHFMGLLSEMDENSKDAPGKALEYFRQAAAKGVLESARNIGEHYEAGRGVPQNLVEACAWYWASGVSPGDLPRKLTTAQLIEAQKRLADICESGTEVPRDLVRAAAIWRGLARVEGPDGPAMQYRNALAQKLTPSEHSDAFLQYGRMLSGGTDGFAKNETAGLVYIRKAADLGDANAQCELGKHFFHYGDYIQYGEKLETGRVSGAIPWFRRAAAQGHIEAQFQLGELNRAIMDQNGILAMRDETVGRIEIYLDADKPELLPRAEIKQGQAAVEASTASFRRHQNYNEKAERLAYLRPLARRGLKDAIHALADEDPDMFPCYVRYAFLDDPVRVHERNEIAGHLSKAQGEEAEALVKEIRLAGLAYLD